MVLFYMANGKSFDDFVLNGKVKVITPDKERAKSLISSAKEREKVIIYLKASTLMEKTIIFEFYYEIIREFIDAVLFYKGYKSYSHEASILFLENFDIFNEYEISELDKFRKIRNNTKYYGKEINEDNYIRIKQIYNNIKVKLLSLVY